MGCHDRENKFVFSLSEKHLAKFKLCSLEKGVFSLLNSGIVTVLGA